MHEPHRGGGGERGLLGGLGNDRIAGGKGRGDLAGKDRQWEIPRRNAGENAAPVQRDLVLFAGRAGERLGLGEIGARAMGVIAQVIDCLAPLGDRCRKRAPALADNPRHQLGAVAFVKQGGTVEDCCARAGRGPVPPERSASRTVERVFERVRPGFADGPDLAPMIARIEDRRRHPRPLHTTDNWCCVP